MRLALLLHFPPMRLSPMHRARAFLVGLLLVQVRPGVPGPRVASAEAPAVPVVANALKVVILSDELAGGPANRQLAALARWIPRIICLATTLATDFQDVHLIVELPRLQRLRKGDHDGRQH
eukprot:scaffold2331_cov252-Pinguiococcus_pyrenoidosus.AAC.1